jgi:hypothetical protein
MKDGRPFAVPAVAISSGKRRALSLQLLDDGDGVLRSWVFACISFSSEEHVKDYDNEKQIN